MASIEGSLINVSLIFLCACAIDVISSGSNDPFIILDKYRSFPLLYLYSDESIKLDL